MTNGHVIQNKILKKVLVSDYDQTFYINDEDIEKNKSAVSKFRKEGNIFVIATGRSYFDFNRKLKQYDFDYDYVLINHGSTVLDRNSNIFANFAINDEIIPQIKSDLELEKSIENFCCSELESRVDFSHKSLTKINVKYELPEDAVRINKIINSKYSDFVNSYHISYSSIEVITNKISKSKAIDLLLKKLGVSKDVVYVIGDGYSDVAMVRDYNGFCMKNSVDELKQIAKKEYNSVSELIEDVI